jgi:hypothetical protein
MQLRSDESGVVSEVPGPVKVSYGEHEYWAQKAAAESSQPPAPPTDANAHALGELAGKAGTEIVGLTISLAPLAVDWSQLTGASDVAREQYIAASKGIAATAQKPLTDWLLAHGASNVESRWLANQIGADVSVEVAKAIPKQPGVVAIHLSETFSTHAEWAG